MASDDNSRKKVLIKYNFPDNYSPQYSNGVWGGFTPQGEVCIHFFLERAPLPNRQTYDVQATGNLGEPIDFEPKDEGVDAVALRAIVGGIVMSPKVARSFVRFLEQKLDAYESQPQGKSGEEVH